MVGRKTSGKCGNCRRRKVKCDLKHPACSQCIRSRLSCPGYNIQERFLVVHPTKSSTRISTPSPPVLLVNEVDSLRNEYVYRLENGQLCARTWMKPDGHFSRQSALQYIPSRLGGSQALDDAVRCIVNRGPTEKSYLKAIRSLQTALEDPVHSLTTETLAAVVLLYTHEVCVSPSKRAWIVHANGLLRLLEFRGPGAVTSDLDRSILRDHVGTIFLNVIQARKPCFLAEKEWKQVMMLTGVSPGLSLNIHLPGLLCRYEELRSEEVDDTSSDWIEELCQLQRQLWLHLNSLDPVSLDCAREAETFVEPVDVLQHAYKISTASFIILISYLLVNLLGPPALLRPSTLRDYSFTYEDVVSTEGLCRQLAIHTKRRYLSIKATDPIAAWACGTALGLMLQRALEASIRLDGHPRPLELITKDLCDCLLEEHQIDERSIDMRRERMPVHLPNRASETPGPASGPLCSTG